CTLPAAVASVLATTLAASTPRKTHSDHVPSWPSPTKPASVPSAPGGRGRLWPVGETWHRYTPQRVAHGALRPGCDRALPRCQNRQWKRRLLRRGTFGEMVETYTLTPQLGVPR